MVKADLPSLSEVPTVAIERVRLSPHQPRKFFDGSAIEELAASIRSVGVIQPLIVREVGEHYELIAGERRFRAAKLAGFEKIPVIVREESEELVAQMALIENMQRVDLNAIEVATALKNLLDKFGYTQKELAGKVGKQRSTVANYLRLLTLPDKMQQSLQEGRMTMGHAKVLLALEKSERETLHERIVSERLSVRQASQKRDVHSEALEKQLEDVLGLPVKVRPGCVELRYSNLDELDRLLEKLGVQC